MTGCPLPIEDDLSLREPVRSLLEIAGDENVGLGEQTGDELRPERGCRIEKIKRLAAAARDQRIEGSEFAFEFWLQQIPPGLYLLGI